MVNTLNGGSSNRDSFRKELQDYLDAKKKLEHANAAHDAAKEAYEKAQKEFDENEKPKTRDR